MLSGAGATTGFNGSGAEAELAVLSSGRGLETAGLGAGATTGKGASAEPGFSLTVMVSPACLMKPMTWTSRAKIGGVP